MIGYWRDVLSSVCPSVTLCIVTMHSVTDRQTDRQTDRRHSGAQGRCI